MANLSRVNPLLLHYASQRVKQAFVPSDAAAAGGGGDPSAGGPPPDASAGGPPPGVGGPPPGPPPGGGGGGGPSGGPDLMSALPQMIQTAVQSAMSGMGGQPGAGGPPGAMGPGGQMMGKPGKPDPMAQAMDIFQIKKILTHICRLNGWELPPDILDGPNRDPQTGAPMPPGAPGSTSDPAMAQGAPGPQDGGGQAGAIPPIEPIQPAGPMGGGGMPHHHMHHHHKTSAVKFAHDEQVQLLKTASDVFRLYALVVEKTADAWAEWTGKSPREGDAAVYGNTNGPGQPYTLKQAGSSVHTRALAIAKMFQYRR